MTWFLFKTKARAKEEIQALLKFYGLSKRKENNYFPVVAKLKLDQRDVAMYGFTGHDFTAMPGKEYYFIVGASGKDEANSIVRGLNNDLDSEVYGIVY